jgi:hypothetical protein
MKMAIIAFISLLLSFTYTKLGSKTGMEESVVPMSVDYEREIRSVLDSQGVDPYTAELLIAQSKHESGNYKNNLTKYHNVFARHYHKTDSFAVSAGARAEGHSNFAIYPTVKYATLSQLSYLKRKKYSFKWKSPHQYAVELKSKGYYEAPVEEYTAALNSYMPK